VERTSKAHHSLGFKPHNNSVIGHQRESHPITRLHGKAVSDIFGDCGLSLAGKSDFVRHKYSIPYEDYYSKESLSCNTNLKYEHLGKKSPS
jgi:hypothetical protein